MEEEPQTPGNAETAPVPARTGSRLHSPPEIVHPSGRACEYCRAPLSSQVFFCLVCGRPYREVPGSRAMPVPKSQGETVREKAPDFMPVMWSYILALFVAGIISHLAFGMDDGHLAFSILTSSLILFGLTLFLSLRHFPLLKRTLTRTGLRHWESWAGVLALFPLLGLNWLWHGPILDALTHGELIIDLSETGLSLPMQLVMICLFPAFTEEVGFRGLLQPMLSAALGRSQAIWLIGALFAGMHLSVYSFPYLMLLGLLLGWMRDRSGSLYPGMLVHALHNAFVVLFFWT